MSALLVGDPRAGALESCAALLTAGTLVWTDEESLRDAADALAAIEWEALLVRPDDEGFSTASMAFLAQTRGRPPAVVIHAGPDAHGEVVDTAVMVARHLPVLPVLLTGPGARTVAGLWEEPGRELELEPPRIVSPSDLADAWSAVEASAAVASAGSTSPPHHH